MALRRAAQPPCRLCAPHLLLPLSRAVSYHACPHSADLRCWSIVVDVCTLTPQLHRSLGAHSRPAYERDRSRWSGDLPSAAAYSGIVPNSVADICRAALCLPAGRCPCAWPRTSPDETGRYSGKASAPSSAVRHAQPAINQMLGKPCRLDRPCCAPPRTLARSVPSVPMPRTPRM